MDLKELRVAALATMRGQTDRSILGDMLDGETVLALLDEIDAHRAAAKAQEPKSNRERNNDAYRTQQLKAVMDFVAAREDAKRYRWLKTMKEDFDNMAGSSYHATKLSFVLKGREWDSAIDAALALRESGKP